MSMTKKEVLVAYADENEVQFDYLLDGWKCVTLDWAAQRMRDCGWEPERWRVKPSPVPPGDLTYEEAVELTKQGVKLQVWSKGCGDWSDVSDYPEDRTRVDAYRRKPTPRMVPLEAQDVPPGSVIRCGEHWQLVMECFKDGVYINRRSTIVRWDELQSHWEISRDGGKTWTKCEKEATC